MAGGYGGQDVYVVRMNVLTKYRLTILRLKNKKNSNQETGIWDEIRNRNLTDTKCKC